MCMPASTGAPQRDGLSRGTTHAGQLHVDQPVMLSEMITVYGVLALTFMMTMYALEHRGRRFVLGFALGCALSSIYGFLAGAWPFGVVEAIWTAIALRRFALQAV